MENIEISCFSFVLLAASILLSGRHLKGSGSLVHCHTAPLLLVTKVVIADNHDLHGLTTTNWENHATTFRDCVSGRHLSHFWPCQAVLACTSLGDVIQGFRVVSHVFLSSTSPPTQTSSHWMQFLADQRAEEQDREAQPLWSMLFTQL